MPFGGSAIALFFYEMIFVKTQEYLNDDDDDSTEDKQITDDNNKIAMGDALSNTSN
jgi:hypothetical protein